MSIKIKAPRLFQTREGRHAPKRAKHSSAGPGSTGLGERRLARKESTHLRKCLGEGQGLSRAWFEPDFSRMSRGSRGFIWARQVARPLLPGDLLPQRRAITSPQAGEEMRLIFSQKLDESVPTSLRTSFYQHWLSMSEILLKSWHVNIFNDSLVTCKQEMTLWLPWGDHQESL